MASDLPIPGLAVTGYVLCALIALIHVYIFMLEAVLWRKRAAKSFGLPQSTVDLSVGLAANQGFYNLILAVGLSWGLAGLATDVLLFFLGAVFTAGVFGAITASPRILLVQVVPALLGFISIDFGARPRNGISIWGQPFYPLLVLFGAGIITAIMSLVIKNKFINSVPKPAKAK